MDWDLSTWCQPGSKTHQWCHDEDCECLCHGPDHGAPAVGQSEERRAA